MKSLENIILSFDARKRLTESAAYPLVAYGVINYISARELHEYFVENQLTVSLSSVQNWRRNAATTLGLNPSGSGRQSFSEQKEAREAWHAKYGYPSIKMLMDGWSIRTSTPQVAGDLDEKSTPKIPANSPVGTTYFTTISDTITPPKRGGEIDDKSTLSEVGKSEPISVGSQNPTKSETLSKLSKFKRKTNK